MVNIKIIAQGAEAVIKKDKENIIKERIKKSYRIKELDEKLRKQRTRKETKLLEKAANIIPVPELKSTKDFQIILKYIEGKKLSDSLDNLSAPIKICKKVGENIAKLHDNNIIHGDLTTSNMIFSENKVYFIDFGLGFESNKIEDKAVDLHLIKQALEAKHFNNYKEYFKAVLDGYKISKNFKETLTRLEKVEKRGRYKQSY